jgi:flagellar biosynthesis/type III secretory pathway M-ring protein FliF/YscJ
MDWTDEERNVRQLSDGVVISTMDSSTTTTSTEAPPQGAPGALANIPDGAAGQGSAGSNSETKELIENSEPSETVTKTTIRPGVVRKFQVAAFIEGNYEPVLDDNGEPTGEDEYVPLTDDEIANFQQYILAAVGEGEEPTEVAVFDQPYKLDRLAAAQVSVPAPAVPFYENRVVQLVLQVLAILAVFLVLRVVMRRALVLPTVEEEEVVELPEASKAELRRQEIAAEVERLSNEQPEVVAALLRSWMSSED